MLAKWFYATLSTFSKYGRYVVECFHLKYGATMLLQKFPRDSCYLCGNSEKLTGEHKIKASLLRDEFGKANLDIGSADSRNDQIKSAQSVNSKHLKFKVSLCEVCNTSRTQQADREFDQFHKAALEKLKYKEDPTTVFQLNRYSRDSDPYFNVFRYFAKILSGHMAAVNSPIPTILTQFAIGANSGNRIWLEVRSDPTYHLAATQLGNFQYAAHGGLVVSVDKNTGDLNRFHSTLTVGPLQYVFFMDLIEQEKIEIRTNHPVFYEKCLSKAADEIQNPRSATKHILLG